MTFTEPIAPVHPITRTHHDISFIDNYEWLRDKESAETTAYLEAENAYTAQETAHLKTLEDNIQIPREGNRHVGAYPPGPLLVLRTHGGG